MSELLRGFDPQATYDEASTDYEDACRDFWRYVSTRTVDRLDLRAGARVLDVPCGTGAALSCLAERAGPNGRVVGIDYAERMLEIARGKVQAAGLENVELRVGDMTDIPPAEPWDAIQCALGLFFVDDMPGLVGSLLGLLRPDGGRLGVAVFGEHFYEPMRSVFISAAAEVSPGTHVVEPWRRTESAATLHRIFQEAGANDVRIETDDDVLPMSSAGDWWRIVMGSGLRRSVAAMGARAAARVRERCDDYVREHGVTTLLTRTRYAVAVRGQFIDGS